ncbi:MAG: antibiotic biosynthesis monooxygenase [Desulfobacteraceae bacterium]|nr:antibiotic biosynthesis monooxygenase [Desulfobacteraceae bacterium]
MTVTVLIKRKVVRGKGELLENLYRELIALAMQQTGYLEAKTMKRVDIPDEYLVISKWKHIDDWSKWLISEGRRSYQERIDALTDSKTRFEIYEH